MAYTWIPFYKELSLKLLKFRNDRTPLENTKGTVPLCNSLLFLF